MGLLTKPNTTLGEKNKIVVILEKYGLKFAFLMYFVGIGWLLMLANAEYNLGTYFSENALLPGLVVENFIDNVKLLPTDSPTPEDFATKFKQIGIFEVYHQNFTITHPVNGAGTIQGTNTYGILRAKRAAGTEALVFSTPYFSRNPVAGKRNLVGIGMMFGLAEYFQKQIYWAKDIVFLIPDGHIGSLAWVKGHQEIHDNNPYFRIGRVSSKSGNIQAAINVMMESSSVCSLETKFHGLNGKLPNLDLVNLMNKFVVKEHEKRANWEADILHLKDYVLLQATGTPTGSHGFFLKYGIESITLVGKGKNCKRPPQGDIARILEATFRSLNNLLERFHQSFFFYLKTTPNRFISIGLYYPPIALILSTIPIKGAILWLTKKDMQTIKALSYVGGLHAFSLFARWTMTNAKDYFQEIQFTPEIFTLLVLSTICLLITLVASFMQHQRQKDDCQSLIEGIYCFLLLELATCLYCLALFNPSLVILIGVCGVPIVAAGRPGRWTHAWTILILLFGLGIGAFHKELHGLINKYYYEGQIYGNFTFDLWTLVFVPTFISFVALL